MSAPEPPPFAATASFCYRHPGRAAGVSCTRCDRPICSDCMVPASVGFQCPECVREGNRTVRQPVSRYGGRATRPGAVTLSLIVVNVAVFIVTTVSGGGLTLFSGGTSQIYQDFALVPPAVVHGEVYRLVTAAFLHYGLLHIAFNMFALYVIGPVVEAALGRWRYVLLYAASGLGGSILTVAFAAPYSQSAGASGAIFGLFGAVYVLQRRMGQRTQTVLPVILINLVFTFTLSNISWEGHIGGLVTGTLLTLALVTTAQQPAGRLRRHAAVFVAAAVVLSACGVAAVHEAKGRCAGASNKSDASACATYDVPNPIYAPAGNGRLRNAAGPPDVVPVQQTTPLRRGGHHA